jgi:hypothetical protein
MTTPHTLNRINSNSWSPLRLGLLLVPLVLACFALSQTAQAQLPSPSPDGGYPGNNTAEGDGALYNEIVTSGGHNTATGFNALYSNTIGESNTANGSQALTSNTSGSDNTANGLNALANNTLGGANTANGAQALVSNTTGSSNTANGIEALASNTTGSDNTANGDEALASNTTGINNTANGAGALASNTTGSNNIAVGLQAGSNLTTGSHNIDIGNPGVAGEGNTIRIGTQGSQSATFIAGIGLAAFNGTAVYVNSNGQLGTHISSARFKQEIHPMDRASEAILALKPVTFRYKHELDPEGIPQFGLVAEEVEKVNPDLVVRDAGGKPYTVRYEAVNAMLLNEFLKEHRTVEELRATVAQQQKQIKGLTTGLQKVSDQLELSKAAPQTVASNQ